MRSRTSLFPLGVLLFAMIIDSSVLARAAVAPAADSQTTKPSDSGSASADMISLNFSGADLVEVIHVLARHLKLNYTIDPEVKGTVTIFSGEPIRKEDLLPILHEILRMNDAVAVKRGNLYRISAIQQGVGLAYPYPSRGENGFAMQVLPVRFFSVSEMKRILTPFVSSGGEILEYPRGNFLIVVDLPSNIRRLLEIKDLIDVHVFTGMRMELYKPKVATAEELADEMTRVMQAFAASSAQEEGFAAQFLPLPRINQVLIMAHSDAAWNYVRRWLDRIDVIAETPGRRIYIYPVENGKAVDLAAILNDIYETGVSTRAGERPSLRQLHGLNPGASGQVPRRGLGSSGTSTPGLFAAAPTAPPTSQAPRQTQRQPRARPTPVRPTPRPPRTEEEGIRVVADPATNSLVIFATAQEYVNIREVLKKLDLIPRQVLMEVLVAEVSLRDDFQFGVEYALKRGGFDDLTFVDVPLSLLTSPGVVAGGSGFSALINSGSDFRMAIDALMSDSRVKVLSHPHLLATDNQPARIQVGSEQPVATGFVQSSDTAQTSTTIQFKNIGNILTIIPQVNSEGLVNLQVKVEVSQVGPQVQVGSEEQLFDSFDIRDAETTAVVQDGQTLVIGGIITERKRETRSGVPFLMDVPFLGQLFSNTNRRGERTELVILITPRVVRDQSEAEQVTDSFVNKVSTIRRQLQGEWKSANPLAPKASETPKGKSTSDKTSSPSGDPSVTFPPTLTPPISHSSSPRDSILREVKLVSVSSEAHAWSAAEPGTSARRYESSSDDDYEERDEPPQNETKRPGGFWKKLLKIITLGLVG